MASQENYVMFPYLLLLLSISLNTDLSFATNMLSLNHSLSGGQAIVSNSGNFLLRFFNIGRFSGSFYIGIGYQNENKPLWVANRECPVTNPFASELKFSDDGNLVLLDQSEAQVWSTNLSFVPSNSTVAVLLDSGNFVLRDGSNPNNVFWQSCDHPTDTWFAGCYIGVNKVTGENHRLTSWMNANDPSPGLFSLEIESNQLFIKWNNSDTYWSSGKWTGGEFDSTYFSDSPIFEYISNVTVNYFTYSLKNNWTIVVFTIDYWGQVNQMHLGEDPVPPVIQYPDRRYQCGKNHLCGPFGSCLGDDMPWCYCPEGFSSESREDRYLGAKSKGCVREVPLQCGMDDVFSETTMSVYDKGHYVVVDSARHCELACLNNCSCTAYSYNDSCSLWYGDLLTLQSIDSGNNLYLRMGPTELKFSNKKNRGASWIVLGAILGFVACLVIVFFMIWRHRRHYMMHKMKIREGTLVPFRYSELKKITNDFSERLGSGGFGSVYKGMLPDSNVVAVKKLEGILQGEKQFRSEVSTIGVIQHINLVRLRGFCSEGPNKLLVYDYMPNGSLDIHLFQSTSTVLNWKTRYQIAIGTARGLSYLHEECRGCIMHCDIKPENILLDASFVPKVTDFGLAKNVDRNVNSVLTTMRGTIGYLAPEWISGGSVTAKVDVYSYGMMLLEIISGRRNTERLDRGHYFPVLAANKVVEGDVLSLLDPRLKGNANLEELDRACKVACWCIQDNEFCRLSMGQVVQILEGVAEVNTPPMPKLLQALAENMESIIYFSDGKVELSDEDIM